MKKEQAMKEALELINGERAETYGDADEMFYDIAVGWQVIANSCNDPDFGVGFDAAHVALMMDWLKTCRILKNWGHKDSWIDKLGYTALGAESGIREEKINQPKIGEVMPKKMVDQIIQNQKPKTPPSEK
tara:strand:- start:102 stop:491 length:390 start_codon:yes stop_codon:yes gene_type:complete